MVRAAFYDKNGVKKGAWSVEEDNLLRAFVEQHGHDNWRQLPKLAGLSRCGKSCRLRWKNYLQPNLKRGKFTSEEEDIIVKLHERLGKKWSMIAKQLTGRSDNEIKNHWHTHLKKRVKRNHIMKPPADDQMREFHNIYQPPQNLETIQSSDSENSDIPVDNHPSYSISGSSALSSFPANIFFEDSSFYYQPPLPAAYAPTSIFSEEQQLVDYAAPLEIVGEWISSEFWTQPYLTDKDIIHTIKFADNIVQSINAQEAFDMITKFALYDHHFGGACTF